VPEPVDTSAPGSLASFFGAAMRQKRAAGQEAAQAAQSKLDLETRLKGPGAEKDAQEAARLRAINALAAAEPDPVKRVAILKSGQIPGTKYQYPANQLPDPDYPNTREVFDPARGAIRRVPIQTEAKTTTMAEARASAAQHGKKVTDAQIMKDAANAGATISDAPHAGPGAVPNKRQERFNGVPEETFANDYEAMQAGYKRRSDFAGRRLPGWESVDIMH